MADSDDIIFHWSSYQFNSLHTVSVNNMAVTKKISIFVYTIANSRIIAVWHENEYRVNAKMIGNPYKIKQNAYTIYSMQNYSSVHTNNISAIL